MTQRRKREAPILHLCQRAQWTVKLLPTLAELRLLAHVRRVVDADGVAGAPVAVVMGNRLLPPESAAWRAWSRLKGATIKSDFYSGGSGRRSNLPRYAEDCFF